MKRIIPFLTIAVMLTVTGCQQAGSQDGNLEISPAPVTDLKVIMTTSQPPQVSAQFKVGLRDTCTTFRDLTTSRSGNQINIKVTVQREKDKICGQIYSFAEKTASLGSSFTPGQTYTVNVNDQTATFTAP